jgi:uncharacterized protein (DUF2141 family)
MKHAARGSPNSTFDRCTRVALRAALAFAGLAFCAPATAAATDLTIRLCGMQNRDGALRITVFERAAEKLEGHDWKPMSVTIPLPPGDYAVRVIHDENGNGILDRDGWLTTPTESYGYSRNARARVSAVEFDEAFVKLGEEALTIEIRVAPWSLGGGDSSPCPK